VNSERVLVYIQKNHKEKAMEEFVVSPPNTLLYIVAGILVLGLASTFLKRGDRKKKLSALVTLVVIAAALVGFLYRPIRITVDPEGISISGRLSRDLAWSQVNSALFEPNLPDSQWRPTVRQMGAAVGSYRTGRFLLSNSEPARVAMEREDATVIIQTADETLLLAPANVEELAAAIGRYRIIGETSD
jgi:hypothetical protein